MIVSLKYSFRWSSISLLKYFRMRLLWCQNPDHLWKAFQAYQILLVYQKSKTESISLFFHSMQLQLHYVYHFLRGESVSQIFLYKLTFCLLVFGFHCLFLLVLLHRFFRENAGMVELKLDPQSNKTGDIWHICVQVISFLHFSWTFFRFMRGSLKVDSH